MPSESEHLPLQMSLSCQEPRLSQGPRETTKGCASVSETGPAAWKPGQGAATASLSPS